MSSVWTMGGGRFSYHLLGPLEVRRGAERLEPRGRKLRVLLVDLLLHHGRTVAVDQLIDDIWGEAPPATAPGVLQNYVSQLRKAIGGEALQHEANGYRLSVADDDVDVMRFVRLVGQAEAARGESLDESGRLAEAALGLWRGDPLADVADLPFAQADIARLRELHATALELRLEADVAAGRSGQAIAGLEAALADHPLRERLWALLMLAQYGAGRQAEALSAYGRARAVLVGELGIDPGPELRRVEAAVLAQDVDVHDLLGAARAVAPPSRARRAVVDADAAAPLERAAECDLIHDFVRSSAGPARLLVFSGEPGIGKSRLLQEVQAQCARLGIVAVHGRAFEAEQRRSYGPWSDALRGVDLSTLPEPLRRDLSPLLPELSDERVELDDTGRLYDAVVAVLDRMAGTAGAALILDDVHWLDEHSVALWHYVIRRAAARVVFFGSLRPAELEVNAVCARALQALRRDELVVDVAVGPLTAEAIAELTRPIAPDADAVTIAEASNGNPLFALEMARAVARGDEPLFDRLDALIGDRLSRLAADAAAIVPWLAAFGRGMDPAMLAAVIERDPAELVGGLEDLVVHGVVQPAPGGSYDFAHDLVRAAAYRRLSTPRRAMMHRRIGVAMAAQQDPDDLLAADIVRHADLGGDSLTCAAACARGARRALRLLAYGDAEAYVELGRTHAAKLADEDRIPLELQLMHVLLHPGLRLRTPGSLADELTEICTTAERLGRDVDLTTGMYLLARVHHWAWGDVPRAKALMQRAVDLIRKAEQPTIEPLLEGARCLAYLDIDMPRTSELFQQLAALGQLVEGSHQYLWGLGLVQAWMGSAGDACSALRRAIDRAEAVGDHWAAFECTARLALIQLEAGDVAAARQLTATLAGLAGRLGPGGSEPALSAAVTALCGLTADRGRASRGAFDAAIAELERLDAQFLLSDLLGLAAEVLLRAGDADAAGSYATRALAVARRIDRPSELARATAVLAIVAAQQQDGDAARQRLEDPPVEDAQLSRHVAALRREAEARAAAFTTAEG